LKIINKNDNKKSIYDLKFYYLFFYNLYIEKKIILPIFYLNDLTINVQEDDEINDSDVDNIKEYVSFDSLYNKYNIEIFNGNNINLIYNTFIYDIYNNGILLENSIEKKIKNQVIFNNLIKNYLKCNKITFLIITKLL
jgi:hypothetical protein